MTNKAMDNLQRFIFKQADIRGEAVQIKESWQEILSHKDYPPLIRQYLGELTAASVLLAAILKLDGSLSIQASGNGKLNLLVAECKHDLSIRCVAKHSDDIPASMSLKELLGDGTLAISITQKSGQSYQGVVDLEGDSINQLIENYLQNSEQLNTRLWLSAEDDAIGGLLIQELPASNKTNEEDWQRISLLANTVKNEELLHLPTQDMLYRLFHEEDAEIFSPNPVRFQCTCSRSKVEGMLRSLEQKEAQEIIAQEGFIEVNCEFCGQSYRFDELDVAEVYHPKQTPDNGHSIH